MNKQTLEQRVITVASNVLNSKNVVSPIDILLGIGYLPPSSLKNWQQGKVPYLETVINANLKKISWAMQCFRHWAVTNGLKANESAYMVKAKGPSRPLLFSISGHPNIERSYRTHYISPSLSTKKQQNLIEKMQKPPEKVVFWTLRESQCKQCNKELVKGSFLFLDAGEPLCLKCTGLDQLEFLPSGNAKLTRRAKEYSKDYAVVVRFSRSRNRYERQGLLIEQKALKKAKQEISAQHKEC